MNFDDFDAEDKRLSDAIKCATKARDDHRQRAAEALTAHLRAATGKPWTAAQRRGRWLVFLDHPFHRWWITRVRDRWRAEGGASGEWSTEHAPDLLDLCRLVAP